MAQAGKSGDKYIGVPIHEFLEQTESHTKAGRFADGTEMKPQVREALQTFTKSLQAQRAALSSYVFVFSRYVFIVIDF